MGLVSKTVLVSVGNKADYYEELGYKIPKHENKSHKLVVPRGTKIEVKVEDLHENSTSKVDCKCDGCGKKLTWRYCDYNNIVKDDGSTYCNVCSMNLTRKGEAFTKTFYDWCVENERQDILERWNYELNNCSPKDINYGTNKKYWFKCNIHPEHCSELKTISRFTGGRENSMNCKQCNSVAQYIVDNFPNKDLYDVWDKDKNGELNPWSIDRGSRQKIWIKCQEKDYHDSYEKISDSFTSGGRCPYCANRNCKVHPKDSLGQYIVDNYGKDFLCKIWSDKNKNSPFNFHLKSNKKVFWRCFNKKHEDYYRSIDQSVFCEFRCPNCTKERIESIIEEKTRLYLETLNYHILHEHNCNIKPINPKTKKSMPYDNEVEEIKLIIEVHGAQHYNNEFYKTMLHITEEEANNMLKQRQLYDRYKKYIAWKNNYEYLELPYWSFEGKNKDLYKQMIDNKIKEILEKEEIA